jgi:hypothetical protein
MWMSSNNWCCEVIHFINMAENHQLGFLGLSLVKKYTQEKDIHTD